MPIHTYRHSRPFLSRVLAVRTQPNMASTAIPMTAANPLPSCFGAAAAVAVAGCTEEPAGVYRCGWLVVVIVVLVGCTATDVIEIVTEAGGGLLLSAEAGGGLGMG